MRAERFFLVREFAVHAVSHCRDAPNRRMCTMRMQLSTTLHANPMEYFGSIFYRSTRSIRCTGYVNVNVGKFFLNYWPIINDCNESKNSFGAHFEKIPIYHATSGIPWNSSEKWFPLSLKSGYEEWVQIQISIPPLPPWVKSASQCCHQDGNRAN